MSEILEIVIVDEFKLYQRNNEAHRNNLWSIIKLC